MNPPRVACKASLHPGGCPEKVREAGIEPAASVASGRRSPNELLALHGDRGRPDLHAGCEPHPDRLVAALRRVVESAGIGPAFSQCHCDVFPLDDDPSEGMLPLHHRALTHPNGNRTRVSLSVPQEGIEPSSPALQAGARPSSCQGMLRVVRGSNSSQSIDNRPATPVASRRIQGDRRESNPLKQAPQACVSPADFILRPP